MLHAYEPSKLEHTLMRRWPLFLTLLAMAAVKAAHAQEVPEWTQRYALHPPSASSEGGAESAGADLPSFTCTPEGPGEELVRVSLPFPPGALPAECGVAVMSGTEVITPDLRVLTWHPGTLRSVRRAILSFPFTFASTAPQSFRLKLCSMGIAAPPALVSEGSRHLMDWNGFTLRLEPDGVSLSRGENTLLDAAVIAPPLQNAKAPVPEVVEAGAHYLWLRLLVPDPAWPRILEARLDRFGRLGLRLHVQRLSTESGELAPDLGWRVSNADAQFVAPAQPHWFTEGVAASCGGEALTLAFPDAHLKKRGVLQAEGQDILYLRCLASEKVPHQPAAWREATLSLQPKALQPVTVLLEPPLKAAVPPSAFASLYPMASLPNLHAWPRLHAALQYHLDSAANAVMTGDDFGNVGGMPNAGVYSMNRLNHCPPIFHMAYAQEDSRLRDVALLWCANFYNLTIWWGDEQPEQFGGTRYNNRSAADTSFPADANFMWRSNNAVHFCTKGYDSFFYAWEETGDPRMAAALRWQVAYAARMVHANQGEARNIGDVLDFVRLYGFTREPFYRDHALRLFRELREKVGEDGLFSQSGDPIVSDPPFIDRDDEGYTHPFAKPYIIGYALAGLPALAQLAPEEPRLIEVVRNVARFLAQSQDPVGGWRYPHPRSSHVIVGQGMEHAAQIMRAAQVLEARGEEIAPLLDAIEGTLQARVLAHARSGAFFGGLEGWERSTGVLEAGASAQTLYARPEDRDSTRDYTEGSIGVGGNSPDGTVYFPEVLAFYLEHRPAERLFNANQQLTTVLERMQPRPDETPEVVLQREVLGFGIEHDLAAFTESQKARLSFPLAWNPANFASFQAWRDEARTKLFECLLTPPPRAEFDAEVLAVEDRGAYEARKLTLNLSGFYRVPAYLLVPKGTGPFPAVVALHDHGAHFSIGKEKVVRPFGVEEAVLADATGWTSRYYGGRWVGDVLAERGYVVLAVDALFWGERGRKEGVEYKAQQALSANLLQIGMTWPGLITWDDMRSTEYIASLPEVDPQRIGAVGLSMGSHRTWMLAAASDHIAAGAAICWMGTTEHLMVPGNNQTTGQSAYSMLVPDLRNYLDYPDVASLAAPKPMLFYNGTEDPLFPIPGVEAAYAKMRSVWESQHAGGQVGDKALAGAPRV